MTNIMIDRPPQSSATPRSCGKKFETFSEYGKIQMLPTDKIVPNPMQSRKFFDSNSIICLADSIRRYGILQPITVRICDNCSLNYEIIAGERRLRAAKLLGLSNIPCIIIKADSMRAAELAIIENIHREDLNFFEQASAIASLIDVYGLTQAEAARILSSSQSFIANKLRILNLTLPEREKIMCYGLSERHARALLRIDFPEQRLRMIEYINLHSLNVATTEAYIEKYISESKPVKKRSPNKIILKDIRVFYNSINRAINVVKQAGIDVVSQTVDLGESVELTIRVPKTRDVSRETFGTQG